MPLPCILLVDDNKTRTQQLEIIFRFMEYRVETLSSSNYADYTGEFGQLFGIFVGNGINNQRTIISDLINKAGKVPVMLLIDKGTLPQIAKGLDEGIFQALEWPVTYSGLKLITDKLNNSPDRQDFGTSAIIPRNGVDRRGYDRRFSAIDRLKGTSPAIVRIRKAISQVAESEATVLILGESGTGKEIIARALHDASLRRSKLFVPINCGAIPGELLESELFGHEKGAFTGALTSRQGRFEMAEGGTLFLDEIGDMPMTMQVKLLRVLQERTFERVGSNKTIHCDVRIVAATHRKLEDEIKANRFREDLFYRLNVFPIEVSPLRERTEDIPLLVKDIVSCMETANRGSVKFSNAALTALMQYEWPGNIRELANLIERMAIIYPNELVDTTKLPEKFQHDNITDTLAFPQYDLAEDAVEPDEKMAFLQSNKEPMSAALAQLPTHGIDLKEYLTIMEGDLIRQALNECNGVVAHAAKRLNMRRTTLVEKLRKFDL